MRVPFADRQLEDAARKLSRCHGYFLEKAQAARDLGVDPDGWFDTIVFDREELDERLADLAAAESVLLRLTRPQQCSDCRPQLRLVK